MRFPLPEMSWREAREATSARPRPTARENRATRGIPEKATIHALVSGIDLCLASQTVSETSIQIALFTA
jgi:hypothetical protein